MGVSAPSQGGFSGPLTPSCGYFPSSRMCNWKRPIQQQAQSPHGFPDLWREDNYREKAKWKPLELPQPRKIVKPKVIWHSWGFAEISATIRDLKGVGVVTPTHPLTHLACAEDRRILERTLEYRQLNQLVDFNGRALPDVVPLLEQIHPPAPCSQSCAICLFLHH